MANIVTALKNRMIEDRGTNKAFPCKTYATEAGAEKHTDAAAIAVGMALTDSFAKTGVVTQADYVVFFIPEWDRWVGAINMSALLRQNTAGGCLIVAPEFYKW
jgi:hypothetical protein